MTCKRCGCGNVGRIHFTQVASGASFYFCRRCEHRWWTDDRSRTLELREVLRAATVLARAS